MRGWQKGLRIFATVYALLGALAVLAVPASLYGVAGMAEDPLSGIFALLLAMPWALLLDPLGIDGTWSTLAYCAAGIILNFLILWRLTRPQSGA